ncbi:MAG: lipopolysaccharide biosynthesis protein [Oscillospiraceae bacterium]|nr:lipopolysaccharide biosynthesis protein [Oscillospiraceae bacterium]
MAEKKAEERNVNVILKNEEQHEDEVVISLSAIFRKLKKYFMVWFLVSVIVGGLITGLSIFFTTTSSMPVEALVSFNYDGIEKGKAPDGRNFDPNSLKNPVVLEAALSDCNMELDILESVRQGIEVDGVVPEDTISRLTAYHNVFENAQNGMPAAQAILDESWFSTQYKVSFNFKDTDLKRSEAVQLLNAILDEYKNYFFKQYGYNEPLGSALGALDYEDYDYAEAVDMFSDSLGKLRRYVNSLATDDTTRFRSTATGYTFADLRDTINTVSDLDLDLISSYISVNNVTKDKERVQAYYEYRIENLTRNKKEYEEKLASLEASIESYVKDDIYIFGNGNDDINTQSSVASEQYDKMITQKINAQSDLSHTTQQIEYYKQRLVALRKTTVGSTDKKKKVEEDLAKLNEKVVNITELVKETADDYYRNVSLANAYSVLVPPSNDVKTTVKTGIKSALLPVIGLEVVILMAYLGYAFFKAMAEETRKKRAAVAAKNGSGDGKDDSKDDSSEPEKPAEETAEEATEAAE